MRDVAEKWKVEEKTGAYGGRGIERHWEEREVFGGLDGSGGLGGMGGIRRIMTH